MRAARLAAAMLLAGAPASALAQAQGDPVRLDDFAVGASAHDPSHVEQLAPAEDRVQGSPAPSERTILRPQAAGSPGTALTQITATGQAPEQSQLSTVGASPDETGAAVSSTSDSRPHGVIRIAGHDRCDPQLAAAELAECQRILELRAQEFNAPAPPQLSAEQRLLAEQRADDERPGRSPMTRLRLASRDAPDADLQSNQELAALYLARQQTPPVSASPPEEERAAADASLAQILAGLQVQTGGAAPPP
jgi:hypothetical protein